MALPDNGIAWPPKELEHILPKFREYSSWYSNDLSTLGAMYAKGVNQRGILAKIRTWFLGNKEASQADTNTIHVSLAQEICRTAANLLYSEPIKAIVVPPTEGAKVDKVQERLDIIAGPGFGQLCISAAEISAALGGVYKRATWDAARESVFITKVDADMAFPEFQWGKLKAVTFWRTVEVSGQTIWRALERHELDAQGIGVVIHGIYRGTADNLGQQMGFDDHKSMEWLTTPEMLEALIDGNTISTLTEGLAVVYAPNILPSALWRNDPVGANLGRSDLEGIEQQLDALDELYSSWLRDIRLGKGRLIVGESMLRDLGTGLGTGFDLDKTIFTPVKAAPSSAGSEKMAMEKVQFEIRTEDFLKAIDHFRRIILSAAGYSPGTFGLQDDGGAITATEVAARQSLSYTTRKRKILGVKPADEEILTKALAMDALLYPGEGAEALPVSVEFPDGVQDDPKAVAEQNQLDFNSQSASIEERVRKRNPDWDDDLVDAEVDRIREDFNLGALEDPGTFGTDGAGLDQSLTITE